MASMEPDRPHSELLEGRSGSAPPAITLNSEDGRYTCQSTDTSTEGLAKEDEGSSLSTPWAKSAPHFTLTSGDDSAAIPTDVSRPSLDNTNLIPEQQDPMAAVKLEPRASQTVLGPIFSGPSRMSSTSDVAVKTELYSDPYAATESTYIPKEITLSGLRQIADSSDLSKLEAAVAAAQQVLDQLRTPLQDFKQHEELQDWLSLINDLKLKAQKAGRTVIAVAGGTGAGKSSLINAVLDEEKLLPTNGMRACTAVITEVSYNDIEDPEQAYRAEVEFVSPNEWDSELKLMYAELLDDNGQLIPSWRDKMTEAGIAYDKVQALYPELTQDMIMKSKPKDLVQHEAIAELLGTTAKFAYCDAQSLYSNLTKIIDSKEKAGLQKKRSMALWPIIRVVRIFVRANALSTGVVLVDLPGTADSNAARSAVANKFMAECTSVWVVARIIRAVDDKEAKNLLGHSSRIQMKMDGAYSHLTFVATQTDSIDVRETIDSLDGDGQLQESYMREQHLAARIEEEKLGLQKLDEELDDLSEECDVLDCQLKAWRSLQKKQKKGHQVYAPSPPSKRSRDTKRRRTVCAQLPDESSSSDEEATKPPLTQEDISLKIEGLQAATSAKTMEHESKGRQYEFLEAKLQSLEQQKAGIAGERAALCVQKRNNYCREAIRQDFAAGIREIDEEDDSADAENYDPSVQKRDYDEVARSLSAFCISSKAYQQLRKPTHSAISRLQGFRTIEDTEIPRLQKHAISSAAVGQIRSNKAYLNQFSQVMNSLTVWTTTDELMLQQGHPGQIDAMSESSKGWDVNVLDIHIKELAKKFNEIVLCTKSELFTIIRKTFGERGSAATTYAAKELLQIVTRWGSPENSGGHGIAFSTYRAICRRSGEKTPSRKARNFNEDVSDPFLQRIAGTWEQVFTRSVPAVLDKFLAQFMAELRGFHKVFSSRDEMKNGRARSMRILEAQIANHEAAMKDSISDVKAQINSDQRQANRLFIPEIKAEMQKIYYLCAAEKGTGCFQRMKDKMAEHIKKNKTNIYKKASRKVNKALEKLFQDIEKNLLDDCNHIRDTLSSDYKLVIASAERIEVDAVVRDRIREVLEAADAKFDEISGPMEVEPVAGLSVNASARDSFTETNDEVSENEKPR